MVLFLKEASTHAEYSFTVEIRNKITYNSSYQVILKKGSVAADKLGPWEQGRTCVEVDPAPGCNNDVGAGAKRGEYPGNCGNMYGGVARPDSPGNKPCLWASFNLKIINLHTHIMHYSMTNNNDQGYE